MVMSNKAGQQQCLEEQVENMVRNKRKERDLSLIERCSKVIKRPALGQNTITTTNHIDLTDLPESPAGPPTPPSTDSSKSTVTTLGSTKLDKDVAISVGEALKVFHINMVFLQPLVEVTGEMLDGGVALMEGLVTAKPGLNARFKASGTMTLVYTAACLWLSIKLLGTRPVSPNRTLLSKAAHIHPETLSAVELEICLLFDWELLRVIREAGC